MKSIPANGDSMSDDGITEAELVEGYAEPGTAIVPAPPPPVALFKTDDPVEVIDQAGKVANALADVIRQKGLANQIQGKEHVRVEGWQLLGVMLGVTAVCVSTEPVDGGYKATVEARTADGRVIGRADALCTKHEKRGPWKSADDYARLSMAQTRATSKALKGPLGFVVSLAGYQTTPAEEMTFAEAEPVAPAGPKGDSRPLSAAQRDRVLSAIADMDQNEQLLFAAVGISSADELTVDAAKKIRQLLDKVPAPS